MPEDMVNNLKTLKQKSDDAHDLHEICRIGAQSDCTQLCSENGPCKEYDRYRKNEDDAKLPNCVKADPSDLGDDFIRASEGTDELETMEQCLRDTKDWLDPLHDRYLACTRIEEDCITRVRECDSNQSNFEGQRCLYAISSNAQCANLGSCWAEHCGMCTDHCEHIDLRAGARAADNETGERLVCLLHTLFGRPTDWTPPDEADRPGALETCKNQTIDVTHWEITCTPEAECSDPQSLPIVDGYTCPVGGVKAPCSDEFLEEFEEAGFTQMIPPTESGNCPDEAKRGKHMVIAPCDETHDGCSSIAEYQVT